MHRKMEIAARKVDTKQTSTSFQPEQRSRMNKKVLRPNKVNLIRNIYLQSCKPPALCTVRHLVERVS